MNRMILSFPLIAILAAVAPPAEAQIPAKSDPTALRPRGDHKVVIWSRDVYQRLHSRTTYANTRGEAFALAQKHGSRTEVYQRNGARLANGQDVFYWARIPHPHQGSQSGPHFRGDVTSGTSRYMSTWELFPNTVRVVQPDRSKLVNQPTVTFVDGRNRLRTETVHHFAAEVAAERSRHNLAPLKQLKIPTGP